MSLKTGNEFKAKGLHKEAIEAYRKVDPNSPLRKYADFNVNLLTKQRDLVKVGSQQSASALSVNKSELPLLSIVMPVFNVAPYLDASINSALFQRYQNFELIIVNDASTDNGRRIIEMHARQDPRIRIINLDQNTLGGAGIPSNIGIDEARGEYVAFIDSDDWVCRDAFFELVNLAISNDADLVIGDFCTFHEDERVVAKAYDQQYWKNIPIKEVISASKYPDLFKLSPVPWRKIYKRKLLTDNSIRYPEGDYFYEDNPLHWFVLTKANRILLTDCLVSYHRMAREGQTMGANQYKLSAICSHLNTIFNHLEKIGGDLRDIAFSEFYDYWHRTDWIVYRQNPGSFEEKIIKKRLANIYHRSVSVSPLKTSRKTFPDRVANYTKAYPDIDVTIILPSFGSDVSLRRGLESIANINKINTNVIIVDGGTDAKSSKLVAEYKEKYHNFHSIELKYRGLGRARNSAIPLCVGKYAIFLSEDCVINGDKLKNALEKISKEQGDILIFKSSIEELDGDLPLSEGCLDSDLWERLFRENDKELKKDISLRMNFGPENKVFRTEFLHDGNLFFGPGEKFSEMQFHWKGIIQAKNIVFLDEVICKRAVQVDRKSIAGISEIEIISLLDEIRNMKRYLGGKLGGRYLKTFKDSSRSWLGKIDSLIPIDRQDEIYKKIRDILS